MDLDSDRLSDSLSPLLSTPMGVDMGVDNSRDRKKPGRESITDPQCIIDLLWITSSSFHKKLSSSLTIDITIVHLVIRPFGPLSEVILDRLPTRLGIWYGLADMTWYLVWSAGLDMVYGIAWRTCHDIWYGWRANGICYRLARYGMVYGVAWRDDMGMVWQGPHGMVYGTA